MIIDLFCHFRPKKFVQEYVRTQLPILYKMVEVDMGNADRRFVDVEARLQYMKKHGIDVEVLTTPEHFAWTSATQGECLRLARILNDGLAEVAEKQPDHFYAVATLPSLENMFLDELDRAIRDLGLKGVLIFSQMDEKPLDSPDFIPFYEKMVKYDLPIWIHPAFKSYYGWFDQYDFQHVFGYPFETSICTGRIVFSGLLERYPTLKFVLHHLGGMTPYIEGRISSLRGKALDHPHIWNIVWKDAKVTKDPTEYFKMMYGDTVTCGSKNALECGYAFYGPEHVVFATDYPYGPRAGESWTQSSLDLVRALAISDEDKSKILSENAMKLLKIK